MQPNVHEQRGTWPGKNRLKVTGTGNLSVDPNLALIQMEVVTEELSLAQAQQENARVMTSVMKALTKQGILREGIQTAAYTIQPKYDYQDGEQLLKGYTVRNAINVKITELKKAGQVIDTAVEAGVNRVTAIHFTVENPDIYYEQAVKFALEDAQRKAVIMAGEMQLRLIPTPVWMEEQQSESPGTSRLIATASEPFTTPIESGQLSIKSVVTVTFSYE